MTNNKNTKKTLLASVLSMVLCVVMLVGVTFAWFTDSVTSSGNIIQSGTLDVALEWANATDALESATWNDASDDAIFNYDKWEPGYTDARHVRISNNGSLALKYEVRIAATGEVSELADVIDVYYIAGGQQIKSRESLNDANKIGTLSQVLNNPYVATGNLVGKDGETVDSDVATIALKMQESAGNEYQGLSIGSEFAVQLVATQDMVENDGFGNNQYDAKAGYPVNATVSDPDSLKAALNNSGVPVEIVLSDSLTAGVLELTNSDATIDTGANTLTIGRNDGFGLKVNSGSLTLRGEESGDDTVKIVGNPAGQTIASAVGANSDITIESGLYTPSSANARLFKAIENGTIYVDGGIYSISGAGGIVFYADGGTIVIDDCTFGYINQSNSGSKYGVANGGIIRVSKSVEASQPTDITGDYQITEDGNYWVITAK